MTRIPLKDKVPMSLNDLQSQMNQLMDRFWHNGLTTGPFDGQDWSPKIDVEDDNQKYIITAEIPGLAVQDIELNYLGNTLTIAGQKVPVPPASLAPPPESKKRYLYRERRYGSFSRVVTLPDSIEIDKASATCKNGILCIELPKILEAQPSPIRISIEDEEKPGTAAE